MNRNNAPKRIARPELKSGRVLSASELNKIRISEKRTLLTPERLARIAAAAAE
ncbi:MAG: hypothetical protein HDS02_01420 [Bacteroides sp.]|nr:hypothetical protein [Barnesiella sp.]MBD5323489.1 hypothetical protein [Bacteroides sp.]MBD5330976.1 hypothetical protein [Bacteroides sp.]MBD5375179.1 hypothetical protein [Bacteroides sp.]MDE7461042.1 hypothetical protein [Paramuribaculum sp.]